jgi:hypothetical protein
MIDYLLFYFHLKNFSLKNLGLCFPLRTFEPGRIFIVQHLLWRLGLSGLIGRTTPNEGSILARFLTGFLQTYENITWHLAVLFILILIPETTARVERSISTMRPIKSYRSEISNANRASVGASYFDINQHKIEV